MEKKKTIYLIQVNRIAEFRDVVGVLVNLGFVYRDRRLTQLNEIIKHYGWGSRIVVYAHHECKRVLMSVSGDNLYLDEYNVIRESLEDFIANEHYKF